MGMDNFCLYSGEHLEIRYYNGTYAVFSVDYYTDGVERLYVGAYEKCLAFCEDMVIEDKESMLF